MSIALLPQFTHLLMAALQHESAANKSAKNWGFESKWKTFSIMLQINCFMSVHQRCVQVINT